MGRGTPLLLPWDASDERVEMLDGVAMAVAPRAVERWRGGVALAEEAAAPAGTVRRLRA